MNSAIQRATDALGRLVLHNRLSRATDALGAKLELSAYAPEGTPPVLDRPVVLFPGQFPHTDGWQSYAEHLAKEPRNGSIVVYIPAEKSFRLGSALGQVLPADGPKVRDAKIFIVEFSNPAASPSEKEADVEDAARAIREATGQCIVAVPHSASGTSVRLTADADRNLDLFDELVTVVPLTQGSVVADAGRIVGGPLEKAGVPLGLVAVGTELGLGSEQVDTLNANWERQRAQFPSGVTVIGVTGAPTLGRGGLGNGDGYVRVSDLPLPEAELVTVRALDPTLLSHIRAPEYPGIWNAIDEAISRPADSDKAGSSRCA